jgi:hypothetical protein
MGLRGDRMAIDPNGDWVIQRNGFTFSLHGDNSNIYFGGQKWDMGRSNGQSVTVNKSSTISTFPIPCQDSNGALGFDIMGASREIVFNGLVTANDMDCITRFIQVMSGLVSGFQARIPSIPSYLTYKFNRSFNGYSFGSSNPIKVMFSDFTYTYNAAEENQLQYSIQIKEADPDADGVYGAQYKPWG